MKALFLINDGFEEAETTVPMDMLHRAGVEIVFASSTSKAKGAHGMTASDLEDVNKIDYKAFDLLVLPGGPHWKKNSTDAKYIEIMTYFMTNDMPVCAICASPTIIGAQGLLKGRKYTCFPPMNKDFGGEFIDSPAIIDKNLITGRGAGASFPFAFAIIEYLFGPEKVKELQASIFC